MRALCHPRSVALEHPHGEIGKISSPFVGVFVCQQAMRRGISGCLGSPVADTTAVSLFFQNCDGGHITSGHALISKAICVLTLYSGLVWPPVEGASQVVDPLGLQQRAPDCGCLCVEPARVLFLSLPRSHRVYLS